ncbi:hypothetical protein ABT301_25420 [Streptomyces sp. NPDC000987]|uniref:hypothetical protein n=1 Tax=Streptomyces sp. NPDC000987 TaxID=3154374 RepID=UPI00331FC613
MQIRTLLAGVTMGAALLAGGITTPAQAATTGPANSLACYSESWRPYDGGYATLVTGKNIPIRATGPYADCAPTYVPGGTEFSLDCKDYNDLGNLWYHGSAWYNGREISGWVYSGNIQKIYESNGAWCT